MVYSKVYVDAREHTTNLADPIQKLKSLLENDIDNGESVFIEKGFITLSPSTETALNEVNYSYFLVNIKPWLDEYGWRIEHLSRHSMKLVIRAIS